MKRRDERCYGMGSGGRGGLIVLIEDADRVVVDSRMMDRDAGVFGWEGRGGRKAEAVG